MQGAQIFGESMHTNPELNIRAQKVSEKLSENIHIVANEPSLAFFRIQEHVRKTMPPLVDKKREVLSLQKSIQGSSFDTEYAINALKDMSASEQHFTSIQELMKNAVFMKQQIHYETFRRQEGRGQASMYRPVMSRTHTVDATSSSPHRQAGIARHSSHSDEPSSRRHHSHDRQRRPEFTRSVQLPITSCLQLDESPRARSSSLSNTSTSDKPSDLNSAQLR